MRGSRAALAAFMVLSCASLVCPAQARAALGADLRKEIRQRYEGKLLLLNQPSSFEILYFDVQGHPTRRPTGEPWTTCGLLQAEKVELRDGQITIDGLRVIVALSQKSTAA